MTNSLSRRVGTLVAFTAAMVGILSGCGAAPGADPRGVGIGQVTANATEATDACPAAQGVSYNGYDRFMFGTAYPWGVFGASDYYGVEFGGLSAWGQTGIRARKADYVAQFQEMKAKNVNVVRWFVLPVFKSDAVEFDNGTPVGLGGTVETDIEAALEIAQEEDMYLVFSLFDFHSFSAAHAEGNPAKWVSSLYDVVTDTAKTNALLDNVITPLARIVKNSPNAGRVIAWEPMNEPDWVVTGSSDGNDFSPDPQYQQVSSVVMRGFLQSVITKLRQDSDALMTVGSAGLKWRHAWTGLGDDFYEIHHYQWDEDYWPSTNSPASYGISDKPVVFGEFPNTGLIAKATGALMSVGTLFDSWRSNGYAGALGWSFNKDWSFATTDAAGASVADDYLRFGAANSCQTSYPAAAATGPIPPIAAASPRGSRFEAEEASRNGLTTASVRMGYSGSGYVGGFENDGETVTFTVSAVGGVQTLSVGYAIAPSYGDKTNDIYVNGALVSSFLFKNTNDAWQQVDVLPVALSAGSNTIQIRKNWGYFDVDYIEVR